MKAVLIGNYGVGNFGDEALKEYFLGAFPECSWSVLSANPEPGEYARLPLGIRSFFFTGWRKTIGAIRRSDAVVFGGGTLFTDIESVKACWLWGLHAFVARLFGKPVMLAFQGVGPFSTKTGERIARWVIRGARFVSVRDDASIERVRRWRADAVETFDPVFLLFVERKKERRPDGSTMLIPRHNSGDPFLRAAEHAGGDRIVIASFQPEDAGEQRMIETLTRRFPSATVRSILTVDSLMDALSITSHCVTERFHGALAAVAAGVPISTVSQAPGDKLSQIPSMFDHPEGVKDAIEKTRSGESSLKTALGG